MAGIEPLRGIRDFTVGFVDNAGGFLRGPRVERTLKVDESNTVTVVARAMRNGQTDTITPETVKTLESMSAPERDAVLALRHLVEQRYDGRDSALATALTSSAHSSSGLEIHTLNGGPGARGYERVFPMEPDDPIMARAKQLSHAILPDNPQLQKRSPIKDAIVRGLGLDEIA